MLETVKTSLRINKSNTAYDTEINDLINAAKLDLRISGVASTLIVDNDPLIKQAIITYVKANFGFDNNDSEKLKESYSLLKRHLAIAYSKDDEATRSLIDMSNKNNKES